MDRHQAIPGRVGGRRPPPCDYQLREVQGVYRRRIHNQRMDLDRCPYAGSDHHLWHRLYAQIVVSLTFGSRGRFRQCVSGESYRYLRTFGQQESTPGNHNQTAPLDFSVQHIGE